VCRCCAAGWTAAGRSTPSGTQHVTPQPAGAVQHNMPQHSTACSSMQVFALTCDSTACRCSTTHIENATAQHPTLYVRMHSLQVQHNQNSMMQPSHPEPIVGYYRIRLPASACTYSWPVRDCHYEAATIRWLRVSMPWGDSSAATSVHLPSPETKQLYSEQFLPAPTWMPPSLSIIAKPCFRAAMLRKPNVPSSNPAAQHLQQPHTRYKSPSLMLCCVVLCILALPVKYFQAGVCTVHMYLQSLQVHDLSHPTHLLVLLT
jgi:hypothetical protein